MLLLPVVFLSCASVDKKEGRIVYTSFGASDDLLDANARRFLVNSCLWALGMEDKITDDLAVEIVGGFKPAPYTTGAFYRTGVKPAGAKLKGIENPTKSESSRVDRGLKVRPELVAELKESYQEFDRSLFKSQPKKPKKSK